MNVPRSLHKLPWLRASVAARAILVLVLVASQCLIWWPRGNSGAPRGSDIAEVVSVAVGEGESYGQAAVSLDGSLPIRVEAAAEALALQLANSSSWQIDLQLSGGVRFEQLDRVFRTIMNAAGDSPVAVRVTVVDDSDTPYTERDEPEPADDVAVQQLGCPWHIGCRLIGTAPLSVIAQLLEIKMRAQDR